jgi:hypothetical protein
VIRRSLLIIIILAALLLAALPVSAADTLPGIIQGTVANGTTGVLPDQPLTVTLNGYLNGDATVTQNAKTAADGSFTFTGLDTGSDYTYVLQTTYNDVTFTGDSLTFASGETSISATLNIYETTGDASVLTISIAHLVIYTTGNNLTVTEVYYLDNSSDRAFSGMLSFGLPQDATPSDMGSSLAWTTVGGTAALVDSAPVPPGQVQVNFTYSLPPADTYTLSRHVPLSMSQMNVLVEGGTFTVTSPELTKGDPLNMSGTSFDDYTSGALQAGDPLEITLTKGSAAASNRLGVWLAVIGVIVVIGAGIFFLRSRSNRAAPAYIDSDEAGSGRWDELLDELAALDDQLEAGTISEEEYRTARDRAKAELKDIMGRENDAGGD